MRRGEIYECDFGDPIGHESGFRRPVLVLTTEEANGYGLPVVVPITTTRKPWPTRIELTGPLPQVSYAQCEQIRAVSARRLGRLLGQADPVAMAKISQVLRRLLQL